MLTGRPLVVPLLLLAAARPAAAELYAPAALEAGWREMSRNIELTVTEDIVGRVPRDRRAQAAAIAVAFVDRVEHPLNFYSDPARGVVHVPMESVLFLDDLSTLTAWFERRGCRPEYVQSYLHALLRRGMPLPPPLEAFAVARESARADAWVWDIANQLFKSAMLFVLAHEVGHVLLGHQAGVAGPESQAQEMAADRFALDHFAAIGVPPIGAAVWLMAGRWIDPDEDGAAAATHPVSPDRLAAVAERLAADPAAFSYGEPDPAAARAQVEYIAGELSTMAELMADPGMLTLVPIGLERDFPPSRFASACPG